MVTLPPEFVATKYPGYFWNFSELRLYSLKVGGELRPLKTVNSNRWNHLWRFSKHSSGYCVSVKGKNRWLTMEYLYNIEPSDTQIPVNRDRMSRKSTQMPPNCS